MSQKKLFYGLFIFPLVIAFGMALILCSVVFLTHEDQTPQSLIESIIKASPTKRWQKAFELSNELNRHPSALQDPSIRGALVSILGDKKAFDAKTRGYMALALAHDRSAESAQTIERTLSSDDVDYALYAIWALARIGHQDSWPAIEAYLDHESAELRKVCAYAAGVLGDPRAAPRLVGRLEDPVDDVRWNAALSLARLGREEARPILMRMLDRNEVESTVGGDEERVETIMTNAIRGLRLIPSPSSIKILESLSQHDKNMKVRQAAIESMNAVETKQQ